MSELREPVTVARLDSLTGLRWWAAFGVFAYHMANLAPIPLTPFLHWGNYGVTFFFVLSGFVLSWSARPDTTSVQTFWLRRFARIYPAHFVALLVAIPVFYSFAPDPADWWVKPVNVGILLLSVVLLQGWSRDPVILFSGNPAAWTLTCEAFFYALHPAINRVLRTLGKRGALIAAAAVIVVAFVYRIALIVWPQVIPELPWPIVRLVEFVLGMTLAQAFLRGWRFTLPPWITYVSAAMLVIWLTLSPRWFGESAFVSAVLSLANELIIVLCAVMIAAVAARDMRGGRSLLRSRINVWLGDLSYSFYLVHATIIYAILSIVGAQPGSWLNLGWYAACLALAIGGACLLHYFVEKPMERRIRGWWDRRLASRATMTTRSA